MADLLDAYPALRARITALCAGVPWGLAGVSALVCDEEAFFFEITKPKHWQSLAGGTVVAGLGGIGGSLEPGEAILSGLYREVEEELGVPITVESAVETHLIYEERLADTLALEPGEYPLPALFTISRNLHPAERLPEYGILAIATFLVRLRATPALGDLFGLVAIPRAMLAQALAGNAIASRDLCALPGVRCLTQEPLPEHTLLRPVWTGRSLQVLLHAGRLI